MIECRCDESLPLTDMWYINGRVESLVLRREARDFFYKEIRQETDRITIALKIEPREYTIASITFAN